MVTFLKKNKKAHVLDVDVHEIKMVKYQELFRDVHHFVISKTCFWLNFHYCKAYKTT